MSAGDQAQGGTSRSWLGVAARAALGLTLLGALLWNVGLGNLASVMATPSWGFLAISFVYSALLILVSCAKWQVLLRRRAVVVPFARLVALYLVGIFFNNFLPGNVGGDVVRSVGLGRYTRQMSDSLAAVFLERFTGFVALVGCAWLGFLLYAELRQHTVLVVALVFATAALAGMTWAIVDVRPFEWALRLVPIRSARALLEKVRKPLAAVRSIRDRDTWVVVMALSLAFYALAVGNVWASAQVFGRAPDLAGLAGVVPIALVVALLPISVGGVGLAEWAYVVCLGQIGIPADEALAVALVMRFKNIVLSLLGGALFVLQRETKAGQA